MVAKAVGPEQVEGMIEESRNVSEAMVFVGETLLLELDVCQLQSLDEHHRLLIVDVVVGHAVIQLKLLASKILHLGQDTAALVASLVVVCCGQPHVPLSVDGVIEEPVGRRCDRDACKSLIVSPPRKES